MWGATAPETKMIVDIVISIHAPRVGSDRYALHINSLRVNFNPRSPCGERQCACFRRRVAYGISIHAPRVGSDVVTLELVLELVLHFNPRSPCGERPVV